MSCGSAAGTLSNICGMSASMNAILSEITYGITIVANTWFSSQSWRIIKRRLLLLLR